MSTWTKEKELLNKMRTGVDRRKKRVETERTVRPSFMDDPKAETDVFT